MTFLYEASLSLTRTGLKTLFFMTTTTTTTTTMMMMMMMMSMTTTTTMTAEAVEAPFVCTLCKDGAESATLANLTHPDFFYCFALGLNASSYATEAECRAELDGFAYLCDCPNATPPFNAATGGQECALCPGRKEPLNPNLTIADFGGATCDFLDFLAPIFNETSCDELTQSFVPSYCGCPDAPSLWQLGGCDSLCLDGQPPGNPDAIVDFAGSEISCQNLDGSLMSLPLLDPTECGAVAYLGVNLCGCTAPYDYTCTLCVDGSLPPASSGLIFEGYSCQEYAGIVSQDGPTNCTGAQATVGNYCGCDSNVNLEPPCPICGTGMALPDPMRLIAMGDVFSDVFLSCGEVEYGLSTTSLDTCDADRINYQSECCATQTMNSTTPAPTAAITTPAPTAPPTADGPPIIPSTLPSAIPSAVPSTMPTVDASLFPSSFPSAMPTTVAPTTTANDPNPPPTPTTTTSSNTNTPAPSTSASTPTSDAATSLPWSSYPGRLRRRHHHRRQEASSFRIRLVVMLGHPILLVAFSLGSWMSW